MSLTPADHVANAIQSTWIVYVFWAVVVAGVVAYLIRISNES
jgi:hypothetical protein